MLDALVVLGVALPLHERGELADDAEQAWLVQWQELSVDRFDGRCLLLDTLAGAGEGTASACEVDEHDHWRYLDLPDDQSDDAAAAVLDYLSRSRGAPPPETEDPFVPPVDLPDSLCAPGRLPVTAAHGAVVSKTAQFVAQRPQAEIVLRVQQCNNANFVFLFPEHPMHRYFHHLVDQHRKANAAAVIPEAARTLQNDALHMVGDAMAEPATKGAQPSERDETLMRRLAECVARHGAAFEAMALERHGDNGRFPFVDAFHRHHLRYLGRRRAARRAFAEASVATATGALEREIMTAESASPVGFALNGNAPARKRAKLSAKNNGSRPRP